MAHKNLRNPGKTAVIATLLSQFRKKPHEMTQLTLMLVILAHTRLRPYTINNDNTLAPPIANQKANITPKKGFKLKRPRSRFL